MKNPKRKAIGFKTILYSGVICSLLFSGVAYGANPSSLNPQPPLGAKALTQTQVDWIHNNMSKNHPIKNNALAVKRINEELKSKGLPQINASAAVPMGNEISSQTTTTSIATATAGTVLPTAVDNSSLACFPPIRSQGSVGSCVAFATTYYQLTHMTGLLRNWDAKNDSANTKKFSPKWTYNILNGGYDGGLFVSDAYDLLLKNGSCSWSEFPYDSNYKQWCLSDSSWRNAVNYRADQTGYIDIVDSTHSTTPITSANDSDLSLLKNYLNNGYVLTFTTRDPAYDWNYSTINNDASTTADDAYVGQQICYNLVHSPYSRGGHCMTIVGYNDDIWLDINNNGVVDAGEKGALKIANSWGTSGSNMNNGFYWVAYDALNSASSVTGVTNSSNRDYIFGYYNECYWMTVKESSKPALLAKFTVSHSKRDQMLVQLGYSETTGTTPVQTWTPSALYYSGGEYAFDGTGDGTGNTICDGTFVLDFTDLIKSYNLAGSAKRWYLKVTDSSADSKPVTVKNFSLVNSEGTVLATTGTISKTADGSSITNPYIYLDYSLGTTQSSWVNKTNAPFYSANSACASYNNEIYVAGGYDDNLLITNTLWSYNPASGTWTSKANMLNNRMEAGAATILNKIYVVGGFNGTAAINSLEEYNPITNTWTAKANMPTARNFLGVAAANGKLYAIGGLNSSGVSLNKVEEYDPATNSWNTKASMPTARNSFGIVSYNGKIYCICGNTSGNTTCNTVEVYDPLTDTWQTITSSTHPTSRSELTCATYNGKIYAIGGFRAGVSGITEIYDPASNTWSTASSLNNARAMLTGACANGKLYTIGGIDNASNISNAVEEYTP
ncbi:MAG: kelch repeat-containing protein [Bacillota bacterium]|nr:kelch repeat-containing protein [Bacillota bacterium]